MGGETAEMPGIFKNKFDLAGFSRIVDTHRLLKNNVKEKDVIMAPSSGLHSNGYSLIRNIINKNKINIRKSKFLRNELLANKNLR